MDNKEMTIIDQFQLEGAVSVMQRYAKHLKKHVMNATYNYESTDFDKVDFLADVACALDNANLVIQAAKTIKKTLKLMRAEVSPIFKKEDE